MRLAVISDIHGNLPALEAVVADIATRGVDRVVDLGDCVSGPLWPRETRDRLGELGYATVRGNHDRIIGTMPRDAMWASDAYALDEIGLEGCKALSELPQRLTLPGGVLACHGTPGDDLVYLLEDVVDGRLSLLPRDEIERRLGPVDARVVLCGHSHQPRIVRGPRGILIVNPGSVGAPGYTDDEPPHRSEAGSPHARYAIITEAGGRFRVELIAVEYDWEAAAKRAWDNGRTEWGNALATGFIA